MPKLRIENNALSNLIKENIANDILQGRLKPGDKLVESKYAQEYGISRAPVREAFYLLTLDGFVQKIPRKGTVVKGYTSEEISDLLKIRIFLEDLAIQKLDPENARECGKKLERILKQLEQQTDSRKYAKLNYDFHYKIITESKSDVLVNMYNRLGTPLLSLQTMALAETNKMKESLSEHRQVVSFLKEGKVDQAKKVLLKHNEAIFPYLRQHFKLQALPDD